MARIVDITERTFNRIIEAVKKVESMQSIRGKSKVKLNKKTPKGLVYVEITASTDANTYTANIYDDPIDRVLVETGVTVYSKKNTLGTIKTSASGQGEWCIKANDNKYYIVTASVFYGN